MTITDSSGVVIPGCTRITTDQNGRFSCTPVTRPAADTTLVLVTSDGSTLATTIVRQLDIEAAYTDRRHLQTQVVSGHHFNPGEPITLTLHSNPVVIGTLPADETGDVTFIFTVPSDFESGTHTAILSGPVSGEVTTTFTVVTGAWAGTGGSVAARTFIPWGWILCGLGACGLATGVVASVRRQ